MASTESAANLRAAPSVAVPSVRTVWLEGLLALALLTLAVAMRTVNLGVYSGLFDEGIRVEQLFLMSVGYRPFKDIFAAQGPLLLDLLHPWFVLFGQDLVAARLSVGVYSLLGLCGAYWLARLVGGPLGALTTLALLVLSPLYLEGSRIALAEVPALAPAAFAVAAAVVYARSGSRRWLAACGLLFAVSLLIKPITLAAGVPLGLAVLSRWRYGFRTMLVDGVLLGVLVAGLGILVVVGVGLAGVFDQIVAYRMESRGSEGWSLWKNRVALARALSFEPAALPWIGAAASIVLLTCRRVDAALIVSWALASVGLLLSYSPLHGKHAVVMIPPLCVLAGVGVAFAVELVRGARPVPPRAAVGMALAGLLVWYASAAPALAAQSGQLLRVTADTDVDPALEQYADAVTAIAALSAPTDYVVTDHPYLTFLAGRLVPPLLVDTSRSRIRSRSLRGVEAVAQATPYNPTVVVLWADRLRGLSEFKRWVEENYRLVKVYNRRNDVDRSIYVQETRDMAAVRKLLANPAAVPLRADFANGPVLASALVDRTEMRPGEGATVTLEWEATRRLASDFHAITVLRGTDGEAWDQQQESLSGGSDGTADWEIGRWLFQSTFVKSESAIPTGEYEVVVSVYDSKARQKARLPDGGDEIVVGRITVR
ncbi:MAG: glycosyltransferase family 39 protein [Chloroflexi bacterium]|nr:glycosyltransferase family 39 protein [Chloroflexota bacterium]